MTIAAPGRPAPAPPDEAVSSDRSLAEQIRIYREEFRPRNEYERELVDQAAWCGRRIWQLSTAAEADADARRFDAPKLWDERREDLVRGQLRRLGSEPVEALILLRRTSHGCRAIAAEWSTIAAMIGDEPLPDSAASRLLQLLGLTGPPTVVVSTEVRQLWRAAEFLRRTGEPSTEPVDRAEAERHRAQLRKFAEDRAAALRQEAEILWREHDEPARDAAPRTMLIDTSADARQVRREIAELHRRRRDCLKELADRRKAAGIAESRRSETPPKRAEAPAIPDRRPEPPAEVSRNREMLETMLGRIARLMPPVETPAVPVAAPPAGTDSAAPEPPTVADRAGSETRAAPAPVEAADGPRLNRQQRRKLARKQRQAG